GLPSVCSCLNKYTATILDRMGEPSCPTYGKNENNRLTIMPSKEQKKRLLKAKIAVALHDELGRVPKEEEVNQVFLLTRVMYKAVLGLHYKRQEQKKSGHLAIF